MLIRLYKETKCFNFKSMMRKFSATILIFLVGAIATRAQQVVYSQTFEDTASRFQNYVLANLDKATPADPGLDTLKSVAWYVDAAGPTGNHAAIATSNYNPAATANDWFITPAIRIGKASKLTWKSMEFTSGKTDTYQVYVSTTEQSVAGCVFNGPAATYNCRNTSGFESDTLDLALKGYANRTVYIGFRLNTVSGGDKIAIDDLLVTEDSTHFVNLTFRVDMSRYIADTLFNPRTDTVDVAGTFNGFTGTKNILSIVPGTDSTMYSTTIPGFLVGDTLEFKFRINSSWSDTSCEFPYGQPNRIWIVEPGKYTYACYYNDLDAGTLGLNKNALMDNVKVYPNPAQSYVLVGVPDNICEIDLINLAGNRLVYRETHGGRVINIDVQTLPKGAYLLLFYTNKGLAGTKKLLKN